MDVTDFASYADDNTPCTLGNFTIRKMLFSNWKIGQKYFFNGLWITKWQLTQTNVTFSAVIMIQLI